MFQTFCSHVNSKMIHIVHRKMKMQSVKSTEIYDASNFEFRKMHSFPKTLERKNQTSVGTVIADTYPSAFNSLIYSQTRL
jgi:hypothetical protein